MTAVPSLLHFPPPVSAACLYDGQVMHARMKPKPHRFTYGIYSLLIDVMRLKKADNASRFFSVGQYNLLSFHEKDHGPCDGSSLAEHTKTLLKKAGVKSNINRILLMCYPRVLGFTFNPISVYFAYDTMDQLVGIIYEVRNTFGEMHSYVAPVQEGELTEAGLRQERQKLFYVSPFVDMPMNYRFRIRPPSKDLAVRILETDATGPILTASFIGTHAKLTNKSVLKVFFRVPLMTIKVVAGINWEAMKLWFKGIRFFTRPQAPPAISVDGVFSEASHSLEKQK